MKDREKIIIITAEFPPMRGGVADYTYYIAKYLSKDYEVYIITSQQKGYGGNSLFIFRQHRLSENMVKENDFKVLYLIEDWGIKSLAKIISEIRKVNAKIVIIQYEPYMYNYYGIPVWLMALFLLCKIIGCKIGMKIHEVAIKFSKNPINIFIAIIQRFIVYILVLLSDFCFANMLEHARMAKFFCKEIKVVPIGSNIIASDMQKIELIEKAKELKMRLSQSKYFLISSFGTDAYYKNYKTIIEVLKEISNVRLIYIGVGSILKGIVKELNMEDRVIITGYLHPKDVYTYLMSCDLFIFLHADIKGGVGTKSGALMAAYYANLPILGCKGKITDEFYFKHLENIYLIEDCSKETLSRAIMELLENEDLRKKLSMGAKTSYEQFFAWKKIVDSYIKEIKLLTK